LGCTQEEADEEPAAQLHMVLGLLRPGPNFILGPALLGPRLALGHACECPCQSTTWRLDRSQEEAGQAPRGTWVVCPQEGTHAPRVPTWFFS